VGDCVSVDWGGKNTIEVEIEIGSEHESVRGDYGGRDVKKKVGVVEMLLFERWLE